MNRMNKNILVLVVTGVLAGLALSACEPTAFQDVPVDQEETTTPAGKPTIIVSPDQGEADTPSPTVTIDGQILLQDRCTGCHSLNRVTSTGKTVDEWTTTVERMVKKGAVLDEQEQTILIGFLAQNYP